MGTDFDVLGYIRVSTDDKGQEPQNQKATIESFCLEKRLTGDLARIRWFEEKESAWQQFNRPVFSKVVTLALRSRKPICVIDYDRVYRNMKMYETVMTCRKSGVFIWSVRDAWIEDLFRMPDDYGEIFGELMLKILAKIGQKESDKKSDNVKNAYLRKVKVADGGRVRWGRVPLVTSDIRARILELRESDPRMYSYRKIAEVLKAEGVCKVVTRESCRVPLPVTKDDVYRVILTSRSVDASKGPLELEFHNGPGVIL